MLKRSEAILQAARSCGMNRLIFNSENLELSLTCESGGTDVTTEAPTSLVEPVPSVQSNSLTMIHGRNRSRRVTFTGTRSESLVTSFPESANETKKTVESQSVMAEEKSLYYR